MSEHDDSFYGYCGCCGRQYEDYDGEHDWCGNCAGHVLDTGMPWDQTWHAQHGTNCPYQLAT